MAAIIEHEVAFVKTFVRSDKQQRYLAFLSDPRRRQKILGRLNHNADFEWSLAHRIPPHQRNSDELEKLLQKRGAGPLCHIISDGHDIDGQDMSLREALAIVLMHDSGSVLSCIPGKLAVYRSESPADWYLLISNR